MLSPGEALFAENAQELIDLGKGFPFRASRFLYHSCKLRAGARFPAINPNDIGFHGFLHVPRDFPLK